MRTFATVVRFAAVAAVMVAVLIPVTASTTVFPAEGARGDAAGELRCPRGHILVGMRGRAGAWLDQVALICRRFDPPNYTAGAQTTTGAVGGEGGTPVEAYCPRDSAIRNIGVRLAMDDGRLISPFGILFRCQQPRDGRITGDFSIGFIDWDPVGLEYFRPVQDDPAKQFIQSCPGNEYATGLSVRYGRHVNAVGLICEDITDTASAPPPLIILPPASPRESIGPGMENDTDRVGADYRRFELAQPNPAACQRACRDDSSRCNAWTYVRPGQQGPKAICYLKSEAPPPSRHSCCISGENRVILVMPPLGSTPSSSSAPPPSSPPPPPSSSTNGGAFESNTDRPGLDIARIELNTPDPMRCRRRCNDRGECRAWTYVRPGVQGPRAVCYLKSAAPPPKPSNCCTSGVK